MLLYLGGHQYINTDIVDVMYTKVHMNRMFVDTVIRNTNVINTYTIDFNNEDKALEQQAYIVRILNSLSREKEAKL